MRMHPQQKKMVCIGSARTNVKPRSEHWVARVRLCVDCRGVTMLVSVLSVGASYLGTAAGIAQPVALRHASPARTQPPLLQLGGSEGNLDGWGGSADGGTWFGTTLDGRDGEGISPDGMVPPGEDLIEDDLRQLFDLESEDGLTQGSEMDDLAVRCGLGWHTRACAPRVATRNPLRHVPLSCACLRSSCTSSERSWATPTFAPSSRTRG